MNFFIPNTVLIYGAKIIMTVYGKRLMIEATTTITIMRIIIIIIIIIMQYLYVVTIVSEFVSYIFYTF